MMTIAMMNRRCRYRCRYRLPPLPLCLYLQRQDSLSSSSPPTLTLFLASLQSSRRRLRARKQTSRLRRQLCVTARRGRATCDNGAPKCSVSLRRSPPIAFLPVKGRSHHHQSRYPRSKCCCDSSSSSSYFLQSCDERRDIAYNRTFCAYRSDTPRLKKTTAANPPSSSTFALNLILAHRQRSLALASPIVFGTPSPRSSPRKEIGTRSTFSFDRLANISPRLAYRSPGSSPGQITPNGSHRLS
mmetsp:Transcript_1197/g.4426  ORF Transcript_1197/g.4426 Transcript_1197/m.4426 type:complete len:243 (-) Transcript_1197:1946-2674(-)